MSATGVVARLQLDVQGMRASIVSQLTATFIPELEASIDEAIKASLTDTAVREVVRKEVDRVVAQTIADAVRAALWSDEVRKPLTEIIRSQIEHHIIEQGKNWR